MAETAINILTKSVEKIKDLKSAELFNIEYDELKSEITKNNIWPIIKLFQKKEKEIWLKIDEIVNSNIPNKWKWLF